MIHVNFNPLYTKQIFFNYILFYQHFYRGTVSINSISLKLKKEFIEQLRSGERDDQVHYFLCLVKCAGQVIPTQVIHYFPCLVKCAGQAITTQVVHYFPCLVKCAGQVIPSQVVHYFTSLVKCAGQVIPTQVVRYFL